MPPCGDEQALVTGDLLYVLGAWGRQHPDFLVGGNEPGLLIDEEVRAADAIVRHRESTGGPQRGFLRVPPILTVEVAGEEQDEETLTQKARWYLRRGVQVVWLLLPGSREVVVMTPKRKLRRGAGQQLPSHRSLPDLEPAVNEFFRQLR